MVPSPEQRAALINVMRWAGIPVSIETERSGPLPPPLPLTPEMSSYVEQVADGMAGDDVPAKHEIASQIAFVRQHALSPIWLIENGHRGLAIDRAASVVQVIEQLARAGSEHAAEMLQHYADLYNSLGISAEAFSLARRRVD